MNHFLALVYVVALFLLSFGAAFGCYKLLPESEIAGTIFKFNMSGGIASFVIVFLLARHTFNNFCKLPSTQVRNAATPTGSNLVPHEMQIVSIKEEFSQVFWDNYITKTNQIIDVFFIYSNTWLNGHISALKKYLSKNGREVNFILLDPSSPAITALQTKFNHSGEPQSSLPNKINESIQKIQAMATGVKGKLRIYLQDFPPAYSAYRFDNEIVIVDYKQTPGRTNEVPAFIYNSKDNKGLFDYYVGDIQTFKQNGANTTYSRLHWEN
ncbi:MAG: hypothetical protein JW915_06435 [Chitinispirillaceae bacterium]|nr:hypothetical protein [Chitinispirillaceae bacterium]